MNAMHAMDEMMSANDINMNLAAITPAILLVYGSSRIFRFLCYALLKVGKSREETYSSFRHILTDIERLLVMRDNPPHPSPRQYDRNQDQLLSVVATTSRPCVLSADDLGMMMLLIHECRSILYRDRRRFTEPIIRSVAEDLAELAGERGTSESQITNSNPL
jgi:ATP synthase regulation protein NCA2